MGAHSHKKLRWRDSTISQPRARPRKIQPRGKRWSPLVRKTKTPMISMITSRSMRNAVKRLCFGENDERASAAQRARTRWSRGSQRKLQRKAPAVGLIARMKTTKSKAVSQRIFFRMARPFTRNPVSNAMGGTRPQASSVAPCGTNREEKFDQFTVHDGRIRPGHAFHGTSHCQ